MEKTFFRAKLLKVNKSVLITIPHKLAADKNLIIGQLYDFTISEIETPKNETEQL